MKAVLLAGFILLPGCTSLLPAVEAQSPKPAAVPVTSSGIGWEKLPIRPPVAAEAGIQPGGEGCQWPRDSVAIAPTDPDFLLLPIDVGGVYRSLDGGKHWNIAMSGWNARGANGFAIDPKNPDHVIGVGANGDDWGETWGPNIPNGIYVSTNKAASWRHVHKLRDGTGLSVAFDASSFDATRGRCRIAYVVSPLSGLFRTEDGGETWQKVSEQSKTIHPDRFPAAFLRVHPQKGWVYLGGKNGLYRSTDGGKTFDRIRDSQVWGLSLTAKTPDHLYLSGSEGLLHSTDNGQTWTTLPATGVDQQNGKPIRDITVSPANPDHMTCWVQGDNWKWVRYSSQDGGQHFATVTIDSKLTSMPYNVREGRFTWHPTDPTIVYGLGGDWVTRSTDAGKTFHWFNNGYNGVMLGGLFNFSLQEPNTVFLAFQDYNGAFTVDGGRTWNYRDVSGRGWGGHAYGGYAVDKQVMYYGDGENWGAPRHLRISRDGGTTWQFARDADTGQDAIWKGPDVSLADPKNPRILFASQYRSADKGVTWRAMAACDGVFIATKDGTLYGKKGDSIVRSTDGGATWKTVVAVTGGFSDLAVDSKRQRIYVASEDKLKFWQGGDRWTIVPVPPDQYQNTRVTTVAVDPVEPAIVYVGGPRNIYATTSAISRSTDAGKTWQNLTDTAPLSPTGIGGPHEVAAIRVHPTTRYAWVNGQCFGMWKIAPPKTLTAAPFVAKWETQNAPKPVVEANLVPPSVSEKGNLLKNGEMTIGSTAPDDWSMQWTGQGKISVTRDTALYKNGPASLRIESVGGDAQGQTAQVIEAKPGQKIRLAGFVRSSGKVRVNVAIQPYRDNWSPISFQQIGYVQNESDWVAFDKELILPAETARFGVVILLEGDGNAWLDSVTLTKP